MKYIAKANVTHYFQDGESIKFLGKQHGFYLFTNGTLEQYLQSGDYRIIRRKKPVKLVEATFTDKSGQEVYVKRSKCRHYFMKRGKGKMERVHQKDVQNVLARG